jgi:hypothetical protein
VGDLRAAPSDLTEARGQSLPSDAEVNDVVNATHADPDGGHDRFVGYSGINLDFHRSGRGSS